MKTETTTAKIFVTDYQSYNEGKQFEHGHWLDLCQFSDVEELNDYLTNHFESIGISDPEIMLADFEGFPKDLYSESYDSDLMEKVFKYIELDYENLSDSEKVSLWNEYCSENGYSYDEIFSFDGEFFEMIFSGKPMEAARAASFGQLNWSDDYIKFNGYGNLESFDNPSGYIDEPLLIQWLIENK